MVATRSVPPRTPAAGSSCIARSTAADACPVASRPTSAASAALPRPIMAARRRSERRLSCPRSHSATMAAISRRVDDVVLPVSRVIFEPPLISFGRSGHQGRRERSAPERGEYLFTTDG